MNRRTFLRTSAGGALLLWSAGHLSGCAESPKSAGMRFLDAPSAAVLTAIIPVVLADALPADASARAVASNDVLEAFDRAVAGMTPTIQSEIAELLGLLTFVPTRVLVAGVWSAWEQATAADIQGFLDGWRSSRFSLLRAGYQALTQLILAAWYGNPLAWGRLEYVPPQLGSA
jgi:hypothetical protein